MLVSREKMLKNLEMTGMNMLNTAQQIRLAYYYQKCGFTRETSRFIKQNREMYIEIDANNVMRIRRTLLDCDRESVRQEVERVIYNMPEMFV